MDEQANVEQLQKIIAGTKGWLMFLGILGVILGSIYGLAGLIGSIAGAMDFASNWVIMLTTYTLLVANLFILGVICIKAARSAKQYLNTSHISELIGYLDYIRSYFKAMGVLIIAGLVLSTIAFIISIIIIGVF